MGIVTFSNAGGKIKGGDPIGSKNIGDIVTIKEGSTSVNFVIIHKGRPSTLYSVDFSNTVTLLRQDVLPTRMWGTYGSTYQNSAIHEWLNNSESGYISTVEQNIRFFIVPVRVPFVSAPGPTTAVSSNQNGLFCRVFLPSMIEVGFDSTMDSTNILTDGDKFDWFIAGAAGDASIRRIANRAGSAVAWWLRSPLAGYNSYAWVVRSNGNRDNQGDMPATTQYGPRPAFVLPNTILVKSDGALIPEFSF